jgi:hypothetical protein
MIRPLAIALALTAPLAAAETPAAAADDLLRFTNGNQIDGRFAGIDAAGIIAWERPDVAGPMPFQRDKIRQIVLRGARPLSPLDDPCHVTLVNGDRIPGKVIAADATRVTLASGAAGTLLLPRDAIATLAPNPFGGRLIYAGPFDTRDWKVVRSEAPAFEGDPFASPLAPPPEDGKNADRPTWSHLGASWFCRGGSDGLTLDAGMPDRALLRFKLGWRSRPNIAIAFHADLHQPEPAKKDAKKDDERPDFGRVQNLAQIFGSSYVLAFQSGYVYLQRTGFDETGSPEVERVRVGSTTVRLNDTGEAVFEIRCDRREGTIAVHVNGEFAVQWSTADEGADPAGRGKSYRAPGDGIGFQVLGNAGQVRISDLIIAEWNGLTDSARSMESEQRDIVLLTNGTDRFSGRLLAIRDGKVAIEAAYAPLEIPLADVAEIHFARDGRRKESEPPAGDITVHLQPVGRISGTPLATAGGRIQLESRLAGKVDLDLAPAVVLEFQSAGGFLDAWDDAP